MKGDSTFSVGDVVQICNLILKPELNELFGVVKKFHADRQRYEIFCHGVGSLALKVANLRNDGVAKPGNPEFELPRHRHCGFWPMRGPPGPIQPSSVAAKNMKIHVFADWPDDWSREQQYLRERHLWSDPQYLGGLVSDKSEKPDFMLYYDAAANAETPVNPIAERIVSLLDFWEMSNVPPPVGGRYRGMCVLAHSPISAVYKGPPVQFGTKIDPSNSDPVHFRFSVRRLREVLHYFTSADAIASYEGMQNRSFDLAQISCPFLE
eukprot:Selendium_serpulae@DN9197_c0_g1_i1.p1